MKKFTFTKIALLIFFSASMISCAGDPEPQPEPVQELQDDTEAKNLQVDFTAPIEEPAVFESETESVAESSNLEPIDDEEGFYMSDKTVLENTDSSEDTEAAEEDSEDSTTYEPGETYYKKYFPKENDENYSDPYLETDPFEGEDFSTDQDSSAPLTDDTEEDNDTSEEKQDETEYTETESREETPENQEENNTSDTETAETESEDEEEISIPVPSRSVTIKKNQYLEIKYPGSGWVYLGETDDTSMMRYFGRKRNSGNTSFTLRARDEGTTLLHFYKNDALTDEFIDDYLEVTVSGTDNKESRVTAPDYETAVPPAPKNRKHNSHNTVSENPEISETVESSSIDITPYGPDETGNKTENTKTASDTSVRNERKNDSNIATVIQNTDSTDSAVSTKKSSRTEASEKPDSTSAESKNEIITDGLSADELLEKAQAAFDNGEYEKTLNYLDAFFDKSTEKIDSGLFLQAQTYESNSSVRNLKNALETYETIVRDYPQSINWTKAYERMTYLKRFYFNIR
ncbi:hypothetical protein [Treponema sp.]|uniref:hypothetical protein n=1 Tax=Treponema sp. TaxID=166 RepID=UPI00257E3739|nr:hypothetical protein [Treponema sp.]MBE6354113.1 hypothetical protein [Treponema sp.]